MIGRILLDIAKIIVSILGSVFLFILALLVILIAPTVLGGAMGALVGFLFPEVLDGLRLLLGYVMSDFQIGAMLGFVAGFFMIDVTVSK